MRLNSTGKNPCGPLAGIRDRDRRPCEGSSKASATQPVVSARTASRFCRGADVRSVWLIFLPDAFCAMPRLGSAHLPHAYVMISCSVDRRVEFVLVPRATGRSTPMTGTDRSNLSYRTILIFFVLLGAPMAARSDTLEDSSRELAGKIAACLPARTSLSLGVKNSSSLTPEEVARITQALKVELQNRGIGTPENGFVEAMVAITLSESIKDLVWTAEIHMFDTDRVVLMTLPRPRENRAASDAMPVTLHSEKFWEGPERILDALAADAGGQNRFVLLLPDGLAIHANVGAAVSRVMIPSAQSASRNPRGFLEYDGNIVSAVFQAQTCTIALDTHNLVECHPTANRAPADYLIDVAPDDAQPIGRGAEFGIVHSACVEGNQVLATGPRDYTQPDSLQAFQIKPTGAVAISNGLEFPGPILALHVAPNMPRLVILNLKTGNYEAYQLSISCAK
jgi:hypothetical protein